MQLSKNIANSVAESLSQYKFVERYDDVTEHVVGVIKKPWGLLRRVFGGHGIAAVILVPETITDRDRLMVFFKDIRKEINSKFVGFAAYKSSHSFIVLVCPHSLFISCSGVVSELKDKTGLHMNIVQGVVLVDSQTMENTADYTKPAQHKSEYEAILSAIRSATS